MSLSCVIFEFELTQSFDLETVWRFERYLTDYCIVVDGLNEVMSLLLNCIIFIECFIYVKIIEKTSLIPDYIF